MMPHIKYKNDLEKNRALFLKKRYTNLSYLFKEACRVLKKNGRLLMSGNEAD